METVRNIPYSVLMTVYKNDSLDDFVMALESIISQKYTPNEFILIADGPISRIIEKKIDSYQKKIKLLKFYKIDVNVGLGKALSYGLTKVNNEFVMRMDSDDYSHPLRASKLIQAFRHSEASVIGSYISEYISKTSNTVGIIRYPENVSANKLFHYIRDPVGHASVMFKKSDVIKSGGYLDCLFFEDTYLWLRMAKSGFSFETVQESLYYARVGDSFYSRRSGIQYFNIECKKFICFYKENLISMSSFIVNLLVRLPIRLMPKILVKIFYSQILRR
jgi:glycosyltransferase involved in cell wall biosynthesis